MMSVYRIDWIHILAALVSLTLHPVAVKIYEQSVDVICTYGVPIPLGGVVPQ